MPIIRRVSLLHVSPAGLESLAGFCEASSVKVAVSGAPVGASASFQPSAAAVRAVHTETGLAGQMLSARMASTSAHATTAAAGYSTQDVEAAGALNDLVVNL